MRGDYSRNRFDPLKDVSGVLQQQGRVQLDADWNEYIEAVNRRQRVMALDVMGRRCVVPRFTEDGFQLAVDGAGVLTIGPGRMYADGLLAENHGKFSLSDADNYDAVLAEPRGPDPVPYDEQPYPDFSDGFVSQYGQGEAAEAAVTLPVEGRHLAYLDVWQREVTPLQDPTLIEPAVGVDTTNRLQTVWRVRFLPAEAVLDPASELSQCEQAAAYLLARQFAGGRLTTDAVDVDPADDPCEIPPASAYKGQQHRLVRVEIHAGGTLDTATFKWSLDNASIGTSVTRIDGQTLTVARTQWDALRGFKNGDWIEITDDWREFAGLPGLLRQIAVDGVDDNARTIKLTGDSIDGVFAADAVALRKRHTRICRWDGDGATPIPAADAAGQRSLNLGLGILITLSSTPGGEFHQGDFWTFAVRAGDLADGSIEKLDAAPPRGVHHHYCPLAFVNFRDGATVESPDCRVLWPPEPVSPPAPTENCGCTVCVTAASHASGELTIQTAIEIVKRRGGGTVCLEAGDYVLREPLLIQSDVDPKDEVALPAESIRLVGQGLKTILIFNNRLPENNRRETLNVGAVNIHNAIDVTIERLSVVTDNRACITAIDCAGLNIQRCAFRQTNPGGEHFLPAIGLGRLLFNCTIRENTIFDAADGIGALRFQFDDLSVRVMFSWNLYLENNVISCRQTGISIDGLVGFLGEARIFGNEIRTRDAGILAVGLTLPCLEVAGNTVTTHRDGISVRGTDIRVRDNNVSRAVNSKGYNGIAVTTSAESGALYVVERIQIVRNHVKGLTGNGITIGSTFGSAIIKNNVIENVGLSGISMEPNSSAESVSIENNQLFDIAVQSGSLLPGIGISALGVRHAQISHNVLHRVGANSRSSYGIQTNACLSVQLIGNEIAEVGRPNSLGYGIAILDALEHVDVSNNMVRRGRQTPAQDAGSWTALWISNSLRNANLAASAPATAADPNAADHLAAANLAAETTRRPLVFSTASGLIGLFHDRAIVLPTGRELAAVRGNQLESFGVGQTVVISVSGALVMSDNRCLSKTANQAAVVWTASAALVANANYVEGQSMPRAANAAMQHFIPERGPYTILGNIANGRILVNDAPLGIPWIQLNATA